MIRAVERGWLTIAAAGAFAVACPAWLLWPAPVTLDPPRRMVLTTLRVTPVPTLDAAVEHPLFAPTRSVASPPTPVDPNTAAEPATPPPPVPLLVGTIAGQRGGVALVRNQAGETVRVRVGDEVDGWRVLSIADRRVTLDQGGHRETARLEFRREGEEPHDRALPQPNPPASVAPAAQGPPGGETPSPSAPDPVGPSRGRM